MLFYQIPYLIKKIIIKKRKNSDNLNVDKISASADNMEVFFSPSMVK